MDHIKRNTALACTYSLLKFSKLMGDALVLFVSIHPTKNRINIWNEYLQTR